MLYPSQVNYVNKSTKSTLFKPIQFPFNLDSITKSMPKRYIVATLLLLPVLDGKLYAMGGFDGHDFLTIVEFYDPTHDRWEESTPLTSGRSGHASAVIYQPSCANIFMEGVEEPTEPRKKAPEEDENKPGPSNAGGSTTPKNSHSSSASSQLHAFSGNRCTHCDEDNKRDEEESIRKPKKPSVLVLSEYEQVCREAIHSLLQMDNNTKATDRQCPPSSSDGMNEVKMDISGDETNDCDSFDVDNPKKYRRKPSFSSSEDISQDSNSVESYANENIPDLRLRSSGECSHTLSRLKSKMQQNISDFVNWSTFTAAPLPKSIHTQDSNNTNASSKAGTSEERKCDLLRKYYKCKMKYCNSSK